MLLAALLLLVPPCDSLASSAAIRTVQQSAAFALVTRSVPDPSSETAQLLCESLELSADLMPGGASFVTALAVPGFEPTYALFAVRGDSVWLLNPVRDGSLHAGLDAEQWNAVVAGHYQIETDSVAKRYARGIAALHTNWGPRPYPFCGRDSLVVARPSSGSYRVTDLLLLTAVHFQRDATIVGVEDLDCGGQPSQPR